MSSQFKCLIANFWVDLTTFWLRNGWMSFRTSTILAKFQVYCLQQIRLRVILQFWTKQLCRLFCGILFSGCEIAVVKCLSNFYVFVWVSFRFEQYFKIVINETGYGSSDLLTWKTRSSQGIFIIHLAPAVQRVYNTIHWINHHPLHNSIGLIVLLTSAYPMGKLPVCLLVLSNLWTTQGPGHWTVPALSWQDVNSGFVHIVYFYCNWFFGGQ